MLLKRFFLLLILLTATNVVFAQDGIIKGVIRDSIGKPLEAVNISLINENGGTTSDIRGRYELKITPYKDVTVVFSFVGFSTQKFDLKLTPGEVKEINISLQSSIRTFGTINVSGEKTRDLLTTPIHWS
jgi:hypothetical protein